MGAAFDIISVLLGFAQIGVVLLGFTSIFLAFFLRQGETDPVMGMHARALIMVAPFVLFLAILPIMFMGFGLGPDDAMRLSTVILLLPGLAAAVANNYNFIRLNTDERRRTGYFHMFLANLIVLSMFVFSVLILGNFTVQGPYIGIMVAASFGSVLALSTFFIEELGLFKKTPPNS